MQTILEKPLDKMSLLPGAVCMQYRRCSKPNCRCANGERHGPYYYRAYRKHGRLRWEYVKRADVEAVRQACRIRQQEQVWRRERRQQAAADWRKSLADMRALLRELEAERCQRS